MNEPGECLSDDIIEIMKLDGRWPTEEINMKDHVIREVVNSLRDIAIQYHGAQQLRERIAYALDPLLEGLDVLREKAAKWDAHEQ